MRHFVLFGGVIIVSSVLLNDVTTTEKSEKIKGSLNF